MAAKSAADFVERLGSDDEFAAQVKETLDDVEPKERHEAVKELGYEFTDEELKNALEEAGAEQRSGELSEDELETVTGGTTSLSTTTYTYGDMDFGFPLDTYSGGGGTMQHATYW